MGVTVTVSGEIVEVESYEIQEEATPILGGDTYGSVGSFSVSLPVGELNPVTLYQADVVISDPQYGSIEGSVDSISRSDDGATLKLDCLARTGDLAIYNIVAEPYSGTLHGALEYYLDLADTNLKLLTPMGIASTPVAFMGWTGELWHHLKKLATAFGLEIALLDGRIVFRHPRTLEIDHWRVDSTSVDIGDNNLADKAELYWYKTSPVTNGSVYPPNKDLEHAQTYSIPGGEETAIILQLGASVSSIQQPVFRETVSPDWFSGSNISLTTENGSRVTFGDWVRGGGAARVEIMDDPTTVKLIVRGPSMPGATTFRLGVAATTTHKEYSAIRLSGTGVNFRRERVEVPTGVKPNSASSEMAPTEDNIFVNNAGRAWELCTSTASQYSISKVTAQFSAPTLGLGATFGRAPGSRFYDKISGHFFRIRSVTYNRGSIKVSADVDTLHSDAAKMYEGMTYAQVQALHEGKTYGRVMMEGSPRG